MRPHYRIAATVAVSALILAGVAGCSGEGVGSASGSRSAGASAERSLQTPAEPTVEAPTRTRSPEGPTDEPTGPAETVTETATERETATRTVPAEPTSDPEQSPASDTAPEEGAGPWWWLLLALLIVGGAVAAVLMSRRGKARDARTQAMAHAVGEAQWLAHDLLPAFAMQASDAQRSGMWSVARGRVVALERSLEALAAQTEDTALAQQATTLLSSVRRVRIAVDGTQAAGQPASEAARLLVAQAQQELEETLRTVAPPSAPPPAA